jgi:hypothetical protein
MPRLRVGQPVVVDHHGHPDLQQGEVVFVCAVGPDGLKANVARGHSTFEAAFTIRATHLKTLDLSTRAGAEEFLDD